MKKKNKSYKLEKITAIVAVLLLAGCTTPGESDKLIDVFIKGHRITAEVPMTYKERKKGLMFRDSMPDDHGMLFIFKTEGYHSFWMKNTRIPLDIAFIDKNKRIVSIHEMTPFDEKNFHKSVKPASYALEVNAGWFKKYDIKTGDAVEFSLGDL